MIKLNIFLIFFIANTFSNNSYANDLNKIRLKIVAENLSIVYKSSEDLAFIEIIEINDLKVNKSTAMQHLESLKNLLIFLDRRPLEFKIKLAGTQTLDTKKYKGILQTGGKDEFLYIFAKVNLDKSKFLEKIDFLKIHKKNKETKKEKEKAKSK